MPLPPPPPPPNPSHHLRSLLSATPSVNNLPAYLLSVLAAAASFLLFLPRPRPYLSMASPNPNKEPGSSKPLSFSSVSSLSSYLAPRLPSAVFSSWGSTPGSKPVSNLFLELSLGESFLLPPPSEEPLPPIRSVHVVTLKIRNRQGELLVEAGQLLSNGSLRQRCRPLSEKMRPGESVADAAVRAVREELGNGVTLQVLEGSQKEHVEETLGSASYPGLPSRYVLHSLEAEVQGVPQEGHFDTAEYGEEEYNSEGSTTNGAVVVKRHFWKWMKEEDASLEGL